MPSTFTYDPATATLQVIFRSGRVYHFKEVPEEVYKEMNASGSKGSFLKRYIKGKYEFQKVDTEHGPPGDGRIHSYNGNSPSGS